MTYLTAHLDHLQVQTPTPDVLASFYCKSLQMTATPVGNNEFLCEGTQRRMMFVPGPARGLGFLALRLPTAAALQSLRQKISSAGIAVQEASSPFFDQSAFSVLDPDGNRIVFGYEARSDSHEGLPARLQHLALGTTDIDAMMAFYQNVLGLRSSDNVYADDGSLRSTFLRAGNEHHIVAIFLSPENCFDHHCYEAGSWDLIRDWADYLASEDIALDWGPGRHGPGNNLFFMIRDPDRNWMEISAELEVVPVDKPVGRWVHCEKTLNSWGKAHLRS